MPCIGFFLIIILFNLWHSLSSDECSDGSHKCETEMGATCVNEIGNYTCLCPNGYYSDWNKCLGKLKVVRTLTEQSNSLYQ